MRSGPGAGEAGRRLRRHRLQRLRGAARTSRGVRTVGGVLGARDRQGAAPRRRAHVRGPHRRRRARVGPGRELPVASPGSIRGGCRPRSSSMLGPEIVVRSCELVDPRFDARHSAHVAAVPLHDPQPAGARSVPRPLHVVGARAARPARAAARGRPVRRRARLRVVLPQGAAKARRRCARVLESSWVDEGDGVLRYEIRAGAFCWQMVRVDRRHARRGRRRASAGPARCMAILARRATATRRGQLAPPRGLCLWDVGYELGAGASPGSSPLSGGSDDGTGGLKSRGRRFGRPRSRRGRRSASVDAVENSSRSPVSLSTQIAGVQRRRARGPGGCRPSPAAKAFESASAQVALRPATSSCVVCQPGQLVGRRRRGRCGDDVVEREPDVHDGCRRRSGTSSTSASCRCCRSRSCRRR